MKQTILLLFIGMIASCATSPNTANLKSLSDTKSHAPTKGDIDKSIDRANQRKEQAEFRQSQENTRQKSEAEKVTERIPKQTTVKPTAGKQGVGVRVDIPTP